MTHHLNTDGILATAHLVASIRPEWAPGLVASVLTAHAHQFAAPDLIIAAIRAANTPELRTPKTIAWYGRHWDGLATSPSRLVMGARCGTCGKTEDRCETERPGLDDDHDFDPVRRPELARTR